MSKKGGKHKIKGYDGTFCLLGPFLVIVWGECEGFGGLILRICDLKRILRQYFIKVSIF